MTQNQSDIRKATSGFVAWVLTWAALLVYLVWCGPGLLRFGVSYYPDRHWAVGAPAVFIALFWYYWSTYTLMYMRNTKRLDDLHALTDDAAKGGTAALGSLSDTSSSVPPMCDIPVDISSKVLHEAWAPA
jgi:hypothetical protein